jgi:hypothetical protein
MKALRIYGAVTAGHLVLLDEQPLTEAEAAAFSEYTRLEAAVEEASPLGTASTETADGRQEAP